MKHTWFILAVITCLNTSAQKCLDNFSFRTGYSQAAQMKEQVGFKNITYWRNNIHSVYFGMDYSHPLTKKWYCSLGFQFCQKGFKTKYQAGDGTIHFDVKYQFILNYVELPLMFSYKIDQTKINVGLVSSYLINDSYRFTETDQAPNYYSSFKYATETPHRFKHFDIGINLGLTKTINQHFDIEFNYQRGFIKPDQWMTGEINYQQTFLLGIKYYFLKKSQYFQEIKK